MRSTLLLLALLAAPLGAQTRTVATDTLPLSLDDAVRRADRLGEETNAAAAQLDLTESQVTIARSTGLPQLRLNSNYSRLFENARAQAVGQLFNQPNTYNVNANLAQSIFQGGRVLAGSRAARRFRSAAELTLTETRAQVALDVQRAYFDALLNERLVGIQRSNLRLASERVTQVEQLAAAGRAARYDVLRARVERSNLEPTLLEAENNRDFVLLELKRLANIPAERPLRLTTIVDTTGVEALLTSLGVDSPTAAPAAQVAAGSQRASVRAAEYTARARRDAISVARADLLPTVSVSVQSGYQAFPVRGTPLRRGVVTSIPCPLDSETGVVDPTCRATTSQNGGFFSDRSLAVQVSWPIFDGLRVKGNIDAAQAQARVADLQLAQQRELVAVQIAQAGAELARARATYAARRQNAGEAAEAFRLASLRFARGVGTQLEVSDAQFALLTAETDEARSVYDIYIAGASLAFAEGRTIPLPTAGRAVPGPGTNGAPPAAPAAPGNPTQTTPPARENAPLPDHQ